MPDLKRRGFSLGSVPSENTAAAKLASMNHNLAEWRRGFPVLIASQCRNSLIAQQANIKQTEALVLAVLEEQDCDSIFAEEPYAERLEPKFQSLGSTFNEGDQQEIEMVIFDVMDQDRVVAEDLWVKASWLSFHDDDVSLRFRFSFGVDLEQDVASDPHRQTLAAELTDAIFPESSVLTQNPELDNILKEILDSEFVNFVERIIYFNGPNGGAYLHHDLERGHAGVVFAQLSGQTYWLALPKQTLINEILLFSKTYPWPDSLSHEMRSEMNDLIADRSYLSQQLDSFANTSLIHLLNETEAFVQFLIARGHGYLLTPGDVLLLPQTTQDTCCWHSVFCIGDEMGQALSFAIRTHD